MSPFGDEVHTHARVACGGGGRARRGESARGERVEGDAGGSVDANIMESLCLLQTQQKPVVVFWTGE